MSAPRGAASHEGADRCPAPSRRAALAPRELNHGMGFWACIADGFAVRYLAVSPQDTTDAASPQDTTGRLRRKILPSPSHPTGAKMAEGRGVLIGMASSMYFPSHMVVTFYLEILDQYGRCRAKLGGLKTTMRQGHGKEGKDPPTQVLWRRAEDPARLVHITSARQYLFSLRNMADSIP